MTNTVLNEVTLQLRVTRQLLFDTIRGTSIFDRDSVILENTAIELSTILRSLIAYTNSNDK